MIQYKKILMTLALLITAVTGAWAQSSLDVVEFEVPADWQNDNSLVTASDLPGFKASTLDEAKAWKGAPATGNAVLVYAFDGDKVCVVPFKDGAPGEGGKTAYTKKVVFASKSQMKFYYTTEVTEWELTPDTDKKVWTLAKMPASDVELQVEYYAESNLFLGKEALANKANISVLNGSTVVTFDDEGKSTATVTEGNTVTAKFTGKKVLGMKVEKKVEAKTLAEATAEDKGKLIGTDGNIYADVAAATAAGTTAVAKIIYIGTTGHATYSHGLALALTDEGQMTWEAAKTACNTTKNTSTPVTGATWLLASKDQWDYMLGTNGAGSYTALRDGFTSVGGSNLQSGEYWSSTEVDYNGNDLVDSDYARYYYFNYGGMWSYVGKGSGYRVRACLAF